MRSGAKLPTSAAEQFKGGVPERSGPKDWRGGLEQSRARRGWVMGFERLADVCACDRHLARGMGRAVGGVRGLPVVGWQGWEDV